MSGRPVFQLVLSIHELINIPLVTGLIFVRWHISGSKGALTRGTTDRAVIIDHKAEWENYIAECSIRGHINKKNELRPILLQLEVFQEIHAGRDRYAIGTVEINLAQFTKVEKDTRRYLLQNSKINATISLTIQLSQTKGSINYTTPPLPKAQMYSDLAGFFHEGEESDDADKAVNQHLILGYSKQATLFRAVLANDLTQYINDIPPQQVVGDIFKDLEGWSKQSEPNISDIKLYRNYSHRRLSITSHEDEDQFEDSYQNYVGKTATRSSRQSSSLLPADDENNETELNLSDTRTWRNDQMTDIELLLAKRPWYVMRNGIPTKVGNPNLSDSSSSVDIFWSTDEESDEEKTGEASWSKVHNPVYIKMNESHVSSSAHSRSTKNPDLTKTATALESLLSG